MKICPRCQLRECRPTGATCWECLPPRDGEGFGHNSGISSFESQDVTKIANHIARNRERERMREERL